MALVEDAKFKSANHEVEHGQPGMPDGPELLQAQVIAQMVLDSAGTAGCPDGPKSLQAQLIAEMVLNSCMGSCSVRCCVLVSKAQFLHCRAVSSYCRKAP